MSQAIYRKYRPQTFADVTDQNHIKITLKNQIANETTAHAYLFAGPRGIGKTTLARLLAKAVNCEARKAGESEPCGKCAACQELNEGRALDIIEIDAASHTGVDNVRENIIEAVRIAPSQGKHKIFIIDEVHMLSTSAFNALLKTLEEPPEKVIFILATTEVHKIPQTILSRCQRFDFHRIATPDIVARLKMIAQGEGVKIAESVLAAVARLSEGCLRDAESLLGQILALNEKEIGEKEASLILPVTNTETVVRLMTGVVRGDLKTALVVINEFVDQGGAIKNLTDELIEFVRTMMLLGLEGPYHDHYDAATMDKLRGFLGQLSVAEIVQFLDLLLLARVKPTHDALIQLPLEIAVISFCENSKPAPIPKANTGGKSEQDNQQQQKKIEKNETPTKEPEPVSELEQAQEKDTNKLFEVENLVQKWQRCCEAVGKKNMALPLVLQQARPAKLNGDILEIEFEIKFHFETISQEKNRCMLEEAINEIMQSNIRVKPLFAHAEEEQTVDELVNAFGGQVID